MNINYILNNHLQTKLYNHGWVHSCLTGNISSFPYRPSSKNPTVETLKVKPINELNLNPAVVQNNQPRYVINIPLGHSTTETSYRHINTLVNLLKNESFGLNQQTSNRVVLERIAIVIGINQINSIDPEVTKRFYTYIQNLPRINGIAYKVFGFCWTPSWQVVNGHTNNRLYPITKSFLLLKLLSKRVSDSVRFEYEGNGKLNKVIAAKIPYQGIREFIKSSDETKNFIDYFGYTSRAPIFYTIMDADCLKLRNRTGVFSRIDNYIRTRGLPSIISLGYSPKKDERPLIKLGIKIDMKVREVMNSVTPYSGYFPEPLTSICVRYPNTEKNLFDKVSFKGSSNNLENRRMIQNGRKNGLLTSAIMFIADGGVVIETPARMKTQKNAKVKKLTSKIIKQKQYLRSLRAVSQTHMNPMKWAENLYCALNFKVSQVYKAKKLFMSIFGVYDPITRMYSDISRFSTAVFDRIINQYNEPLSSGQQNLLNTAKTHLLALGMSNQMIESIILAAKESGKAIYLELKRVSHL